VLLVQLPPSLPFDPALAEAFFRGVRGREPNLRIACEPRHQSWFTAAANGLLSGFEVARVAADPALHPLAGEPGGWGGFSYFRWHGAPRVYYSAYGPEIIRAFAQCVERHQRESAWCIFDNTALGAATADALEFMRAFRIAEARTEATV